MTFRRTSRAPWLLRAIAWLIIRGRHAAAIRDDLADLYVEERTGGTSRLVSAWRYSRRMVASAFSVGADGFTRAWWRQVRWREMRGGSVRADLQFASRLIRKTPLPMATALAGLAVTIAVASVAFSLIDATLLRPYGMADPDRVVRVLSAGRGSRELWPYEKYLALREATDVATIEAQSARLARIAVTREESPDRPQTVVFTSSGYHQMLGARPVLGRLLQESDHAPGAPPVVLASQRFWAARLGGADSAIGTSIWINGQAATLVGVLAQGFTGPLDAAPALWAPLGALDDLAAGPEYRGTDGAPVEVFGRLVGGTSIDVAAERLSALVRPTTPDPPKPFPAPFDGVRLYSAASPIDGPEEADVQFGLVVVTLLVGLLLALASINAANILLAAAVTRQREMSVRLALGATPARLVRQLVSESLFLASLAGAAGLVLAVWLAPIAGRLLDIPDDRLIGLDWRITAFTVIVSLACGLWAGLSPARFGARRDALPGLQRHGGAHTMGRRFRGSLVAFQSAAAMLLLTLAALLARSALDVAGRDPGFDARRLTAVTLSPQRAGVNRAEYLARAAAAVQAVPGVEVVAVSEQLPFGSSSSRHRLQHGGRTFVAALERVDGAYLRALGVSVLRGRPLTDADVTGEADVAVISTSVARTFFAAADPLGLPLSAVLGPPARGQADATIVGVVPDPMLYPPDGDKEGAVFQPIRASAKPNAFNELGLPMLPNLLVRSRDAATTTGTIESALRRLGNDVRPTAWSVGDRVTGYLDWKGTLASITTATGMIALVLALVGVFGVSSFAATQRAHEVSVRLAIGADRADIRRLLIGDGLRPVVTGAVIGLGFALLASRSLGRAVDLTGLASHDPVALVLAALVVLLGGLLATLAPARRAARADPLALLRPD